MVVWVGLSGTKSLLLIALQLRYDQKGGQGSKRKMDLSPFGAQDWI